MSRLLVGIAGGSGSGKSTLAMALYRKYPNKITLVYLDDYYKKPEDAPRYEGGVDWDHPDALRFDDLLRDIGDLLKGKLVTVHTKSELYNPAYRPELRNKIEQVLEPKPIVLLEGHLALYDPRICKLMSLSIFLDAPIEESVRRRTINKIAQPQSYFEKVLFPAHKSTVEPAKDYADIVVDVSTHSLEEVFQVVDSALKMRRIISD